ncbi:MAG: PEP-CTERM sorting domain-containing protein [Emcibacter sp.]|nr:PEP-CTERM sorting domain-containing protein [Emcibacter sp.]
MTKKQIISAALVCILMPVSAFATVIGGSSSSGTFEYISPIPGGFTVGENNQQSPNLFAFDEDQNINITSTITVNVGANPVSGDVVASHYIFFDPDSTTSTRGWVDFDADIYGIITQTTELLASDFLANTGVTYLNPGLRGLESGDTATIDSTFAYRVNIDFTASNPGDYIRVLTMRSPLADVPEPSMIGLLGLGLLGLLGLRRRKQ